MSDQVENTIVRLRDIVGASNNAELARKLGLDQSTISSWRARGRVPKRFVEFGKNKGDLTADLEPPVWQELQDCGQALALARFTLLRAELANSGDVDKAIQAFRDLKPFLFLLYRAIHELRLKMENAGIDLATAQAVLLHEDLRDPQKTTARVAAQLAEDFRDNPGVEPL